MSSSLSNDERAERIERAQMLVERASPGPWFSVDADQCEPIVMRADEKGHITVSVLGVDTGTPGWEEGRWLVEENDIRLMAASRDLVPWLLSELRSALQREAEAEKDAERYRFARERFVMESERDGDSVSNDEFDAELDKEMLEWRASALLMATAAKHGYRLASEVILDCAEGSRSLPSREE